jgi:hypothetical protein
VESLRNAMFRVEVGEQSSKKVLLCTTCGKMRQGHIRILIGAVYFFRNNSICEAECSNVLFKLIFIDVAYLYVQAIPSLSRSPLMTHRGAESCTGLKAI